MLIGILVIQTLLLAAIALVLWRGLRPARRLTHGIALAPMDAPPDAAVEILKAGKHHGWRPVGHPDIEEALRARNDLSVRWPDGTVQVVQEPGSGSV